MEYPQNNYSTDPEEDHRLKLWYKARSERLSFELSELKDKYKILERELERRKNEIMCSECGKFMDRDSFMTHECEGLGS